MSAHVCRIFEVAFLYGRHLGKYRIPGNRSLSGQKSPGIHLFRNSTEHRTRHRTARRITYPRSRYDNNTRIFGILGREISAKRNPMAYYISFVSGFSLMNLGRTCFSSYLHIIRTDRLATVSRTLLYHIDKHLLYFRQCSRFTHLLCNHLGLKFFY